MPFGLDPVVLGLVCLLAGAALLLHGEWRRRNASPSPSGRWFVTGPRRFLTAYMSLGSVPLPAWAKDRPDVLAEMFYGAAFMVAGIGGIFFFPR